MRTLFLRLVLSSFPVINLLKKTSSFRFETRPALTSSSFSSSISLKSDLTSFPPRVNMIFSTPSFKKHDLAVTSNLDSANSADFEDNPHAYEHKDPNVNIEFEPFVLIRSKNKAFEDEIITSSFLKELATASSNKANEKLDRILASETKDSIDYPSLSSNVSFAPASRDLPSEVKPSASTLQITNDHFDLHLSTFLNLHLLNLQVLLRLSLKTYSMKTHLTIFLGRTSIKL